MHYCTEIEEKMYVFVGGRTTHATTGAAVCGNSHSSFAPQRLTWVGWADETTGIDALARYSCPHKALAAVHSPKVVVD